MGLYYMDEGKGIDMVDLVFLNKVSNIKPIPGKANIMHYSTYIVFLQRGSQNAEKVTHMKGRLLDQAYYSL